MGEKEIQELKAKQRARLEAAIQPQGSGGYGRQREVRRKPVTPPEWVYWPAERRVELWQAVSLSLGLDPDSLEHWGNTIKPESFPSAEVQADFAKRRDLICGLAPYVCAPLSQFVPLLGKLPMPPELAALAELVASANPMSNATPLEIRHEADNDPQKASEQCNRTELEEIKKAAPTGASAPFGAPENDEPPASVATHAYNIAELAALFEPVKAAQLEAMFPSNGKWTEWTERAKRNGLKDTAKVGRAIFNPYHAAVWWLAKGPKDWKWERCLRVLANNLPTRSTDSKHLLTGYD